MKKIMVLALALVMLCGLMNVNAFASADDPEVTVYVTTGMFSLGGYDDTNRCPVVQTYKSSEDPGSHLLTGFSGAITVKSSVIQTNLSSIRAKYAPSGYTSDINVLDAIICALTVNTSHTISCGWDSYNSPNGGYINSFTPGGVPSYNATTSAEKEEYVDGVLTPVQYTVYSGTGLKIAYNTASGGTITEPSTYSTGQTIVDGMVIVLDLSAYEIYYPVSD